MDNKNINMQTLEKLLVTDFIENKADYLENVVTQIETSPMSFNSKNKLLLEVLNKGIQFGINKGIFINKCTEAKVRESKEKRRKKWIIEMVYGMNEVIESNINKYKYRKK